MDETTVPRVYPQAIGFPMGAIAGEFLLLIGLLFMMLGIGAYISDWLDIKGSGEFFVGLFTTIVAAILLTNSIRRIRAMPRPPPPASKPATPAPKEKERESGAYR